MSETRSSELSMALAIVGLVVGSIGLVGSIVPLLGAYALFVAVPALAISLVSLMLAYTRESGRTLAMAATLLATIAVCLSGYQKIALEKAKDEVRNTVKEFRVNAEQGRIQAQQELDDWLRREGGKRNSFWPTEPPGAQSQRDENADRSGPSSVEASASRAEEPAAWTDDIQKAIGQAKLTGKPVLVNGWAVWATSSLTISTALRDPVLLPVLARFELVELDMDRKENQAIWDRYDIKGMPWLAVLDSEGNQIDMITGLNGLPTGPQFAKALGDKLSSMLP